MTQCFALSLCSALGSKMDPEVMFYKAAPKVTHLTIFAKVSWTHVLFKHDGRVYI